MLRGCGVKDGTVMMDVMNRAQAAAKLAEGGAEGNIWPHTESLDCEIIYRDGVRHRLQEARMSEAHPFVGKIVHPFHHNTPGLTRRKPRKRI